jgi:hypothetical protein
VLPCSAKRWHAAIRYRFTGEFFYEARIFPPRIRRRVADSSASGSAWTTFAPLLRDRLITGIIDAHPEAARVLSGYKPRIAFTTPGSGVDPRHKADHGTISQGFRVYEIAS